jgi:hypothetical protein
MIGKIAATEGYGVEAGRFDEGASRFSKEVRDAGGARRGGSA